MTQLLLESLSQKTILQMKIIANRRVGLNILLSSQNHFPTPSAISIHLEEKRGPLLLEVTHFWVGVYTKKGMHV
jgi:hypothetical protein